MPSSQCRAAPLMNGTTAQGGVSTSASTGRRGWAAARRRWRSPGSSESLRNWRSGGKSAGIRRRDHGAAAGPHRQPANLKPTAPALAVTSTEPCSMTEKLSPNAPRRGGRRRRHALHPGWSAAALVRPIVDVLASRRWRCAPTAPSSTTSGPIGDAHPVDALAPLSPRPALSAARDWRPSGS